MSEYNPTGLRAAAANLQQTAQTLTAALPPAAPTVPPASDPISVAAAASVDAQSAAMRASILGAIAETLAAASGLHAAANGFDAQEAANTASLGMNGSAGAAAEPIAAIADHLTKLPPQPPVPAAPAVPAPIPAADPEPMAVLLQAGPGSVGLHGHTTSWTAMSQALAGASASSAAAAATVQSSWVSPQGVNASTALGRLARWYEGAGTSATNLAATSAHHATQFEASKASHPNPPTVLAAKKDVADAQVAAASNPASAPALAGAMQRWTQLVSGANTTVAGYQAHTVAAPRTDAPAPPRITRRGAGKTGDKGSGGKHKLGSAGKEGAEDLGRLGNSAESAAKTGKKALDTATGKASNDKLLTTAAQIGLQVATQGVQAATSLLSAASSSAGKLATTGLGRNNDDYNYRPGTGLPGTGLPGNLTGAGGPSGTPLGNEPVGPGATGADVGGDDKGTEPSAINGYVTPIMASPEMPRTPAGATPPPTATLAAGMHMPGASPYMGGMGGMAGMGGGASNTTPRNERLRPDRPVYVDTTAYTDPTISEACIEMAPEITPLFADDPTDDDDFVSS